jgi:hypothetical protein
MSSNPQLKALAQEAAAKIKTLSAAHKAEIKAVYQDFQAKAKALQPNEGES